jgi:hypothetical protein
LKKKTEQDSRISQEVVQKVLKSLEEVDKTLAEHNVTLSVEERRSFPRISVRSAEYLRLAHAFATSQPELLPSFVNLEEFSINFQNAEALAEVLRKFESVERKLKDMLLYARGKTFEPANECHAMARRAAKRRIPGADIIVKQMNEARGRKRSPKAKVPGEVSRQAQE